jgi:hypothetical protein
MDLLERINFYENGYDLIANYEVGRGTKIHLDEKGNCRFCGLKSPKVSFNNQSHAAPEFLGNHQLIQDSECNSCNKYFSSHLEDSLDKYTRHHRTVGQVKGKTRKVPSYKSKDHRARLDVKNEEMPKILARRDEAHFSLNIATKTATLMFQIPAYIPIAVYKSLVKIALSIIDKKEISNFTSAVRWIREPDLGYIKDHPPHPLQMLRGYVPGPRPFPGLKLMVYKKKDLVSLRFSYMLLIAFGNIVYQIIVPSNNDRALPLNSMNFVAIPIPQEFISKHGFVTWDVIDLERTTRTKDAEEEINFSFEGIEEKPEFVGMSLEELGYK